MNVHLLNEKISDKGIKKQYIAEKLGVNPNSLSNKLKGTTKFTIDEVNSLVGILNLSKEDVLAIFFAPSRDC